MKKIILIMTLAVLSSMAVLAQGTDKKAAQTVPASTAAATKKAPTLHYVWMKGQLSNCMGATHEVQTTDVKLSNGTTITTKGEVIAKDGKKTQMIDGECADLNGKIMDHKKAHIVMDMKKSEEKKN